jgi:hypothetical protein
MATVGMPVAVMVAVTMSVMVVVIVVVMIVVAAHPGLCLTDASQGQCGWDGAASGGWRRARFHS